MDELVQALLLATAEVDQQIQDTKNKDLALYLQGGRDALFALAKAFGQSSSLAVDLFNRSVVVEEVK